MPAAGTGLRRLAQGTTGFPGSAREAQFALAQAIARWLNAPGAQGAIDGINKARQFRTVPTVEEVTAATTKVIGPPYEPKNVPEEYVATGTEFLGGLFVPGGPVRKAAQWLIPALVTETGGQIARRTIPQYEPHVRLGLGLGAEFLPGGFVRMATGRHVMPAPTRTVGTLQPPNVPVVAGSMTGGEGPRYVGGGPVEGKPGAIAEQGASFPNAIPESTVEGVSFLPAQPQQSFPSVPPDSKLARILREAVQPSVPHSPIPPDHPARGVQPVENKPGVIVDPQGNTFTHTVPDRAAIDSYGALHEADAAANAADNAPQNVPVITTPPEKLDRLMSVPAQAKPGTASESPPDELAGLFREGVQPNVPQTPIPRYDPPRGVSPRVADLIVNPDVRQKVIETIHRGIRMGGLDWYNAEPLRLAFIDELGEVAGNSRFEHFMDLIAATSARSRVPENVRNASYYLTLNGRRLPEKNPQPYGHLAQKMHRSNVERVWSGGLNPLTHAKSVSMGANAKGNYLPVTIDMHAYRLLAMLSGDPRFLATFVPTKSGVPRNIRKEFTAGLIGPDELRDPNFWLPQPGRNEYAALERYFQEIARELGLTPAQVQAAAWIGGSELTGLRSDPLKNLMGFFKDRLLLTANDKGMAPRDVLRRLIRAELPLIALGGVALAPQFRPREEGPSDVPSAAP